MSPVFDSVLIANRGEIALRIARTCRAMRIRTAAVYSDADAGSPHVRACDRAIRIGPPPARESYLRIDRILDAARAAQVRAVHPGYGFLSENAAFAEACADAGFVFIGPPPAAMRAMGDKIAAKQTVEAAGVETVPGYLGANQSSRSLASHAKRIGAPLLIKAAAGGGGKGMRVVENLADFAEALEGAKREAAAAFGDDTVFLEKYLQAPRHIEFQVLADARGDCIHLGERECSIQRRHQKVLEETPSVALSPELREEMGQSAVRAALAVGYVNAGTVEFMLDAQGRYYFLEMNTRLQVEHPITEEVTGIDLVREQLRIAAGLPLAFDQSAVARLGHAIEVRIYAEDADRGFLPSTGIITAFEPPEGPGLRNDSGVAVGSNIGVEYDPMLAKLIAHDRTRDDCIERLAAALDAYVIGGVVTNIPFLRRLVDHPAFRRGETTTAFIREHFAEGVPHHRKASDLTALAAAGALQSLSRDSSADPWLRLGAWRHGCEPRMVSYTDGRTVLVESAEDGSWRCTAGSASAIVRSSGGIATILADGNQTSFVAWFTRDGVAVNIGGAVSEVALAKPPSASEAAKSRHGGHAGAGVVEAPMSGKVVKVGAIAGHAVRARDVLVVMEAMKMEHTIVAPYDGTVVSMHVKAGDLVGAGDVLAEVEALT